MTPGQTQQLGLAPSLEILIRSYICQDGCKAVLGGRGSGVMESAYPCHTAVGDELEGLVALRPCRPGDAMLGIVIQHIYDWDKCHHLGAIFTCETHAFADI